MGKDKRICRAREFRDECGSASVKSQEYFLAFSCFQEEIFLWANRDCLDEYPGWLDLDEYNPYKLVKKTDGVMWEDFLWLKFPGEDITWKDVRIRGAD